MAQDFERAKNRLNNIGAIEPLLGALRTLSMGTWQMALNQISRMSIFKEKFDHILVQILPEIEDKDLRPHKKPPQAVELADTIVLIVGSERGLCGKFNHNLITYAKQWIQEHNLSSYQIWAMGSRMIRELERNNLHLSWRKPLPGNELLSYPHAYLLTQNWLEQFEDYAFNHFIVFFNQSTKSGGYQCVHFSLLPYAIHQPSSTADETQSEWPPPIIETNPKGIYHQIIEHYIASSFYQILLQSAAAEHSSRYYLMQEAEENAEEIMADLQQVLNKERKRKITQEMQELASGAGLLDN